MPLTMRHRDQLALCARLYPKRRLTPEGKFWALYVVAVGLVVLWWLS